MTDPRAQTQLLVPELGMANTPLVLSTWLADVGSRVTQGDRLVELWAGEATIDLPAPANGVLVAKLAAEDEVVQVGQPVATIALNAHSFASLPPFRQL